MGFSTADVTEMVDDNGSLDLSGVSPLRAADLKPVVKTLDECEEKASLTELRFGAVRCAAGDGPAGEDVAGMQSLVLFLIKNKGLKTVEMKVEGGVLKSMLQGVQLMR